MKVLTLAALCFLFVGLQAQTHLHHTIQVPASPCETLSVAELIPNVKLFPNPAVSALTIELPEFTGLVTLSILELDGRILFTDHFHQSSIRLEISHLPPGLYILTASTGTFYYNAQLLIAR